MTNSPRPNVVVCTLDAVRASRLSLYGYDRVTTPHLETAASDSLVCDQAFTLAPFTQSACIQIFTSSRPLSFGGTDNGARGRPKTLFQHFRDAGYFTRGLSTAHWVSSYYGYDGLEDENQLFTLNTLCGMAIANVQASLRLFYDGTVSMEQLLSFVTPAVEKLFHNADTYCDIHIESLAAHRDDFPDALFTNAGYDFRKVKSVTEKHRRAFRNDGETYVRTHLRRIPSSHEWIAADWRMCRFPTKFASEIAFRLSNRALQVMRPALARQRSTRFKYYPDAHALADKVVSMLDETPLDRPFFIWAHFKDAHLPYVSGAGRAWYRTTPEHLSALGYPDGIDPVLPFFRGKPKTEEQAAAFSALYDASIRSTDIALGRIIDALDRADLGENTIFAVIGDHGEEQGEHGDFGHSFLLYEHNTRVPMLFRRRGMTGERITNLVAHPDFAPTLADMAGLDPDPAWEGRSVAGSRDTWRDHVLHETFCRGNCDFDNRPLYFGVRTERHKYIWKEYRDGTDKFGPEENELYDLVNDPDEKINAYRADRPEVAVFDRIIARRMAEIPEISADRIVRNFGALGTETLKKSPQDSAA